MHTYVAINQMSCLYRWDLTGQVSSRCGFLYSNGTALTFENANIREVATKPVDTTYASRVSFYLLFGKKLVHMCTHITYVLYTYVCVPTS